MSDKCSPRRLVAGIANALLLGASITAGSTTALAAEPAAAEARLGFLSLKVLDLERSLAFYSNVLGLKEQRRLKGGPDTVEVLMSYGDLSSQTGVMLIHDAKRTKTYELGEGFSRFILYVSNLDVMEKKLRDAGATIIRPVTRIESLKISILIAKDPDGYVIEFIQRGPAS